MKNSDFVIDDEDYVNLIHNEEDMKKFQRMKEIWDSGEFAKPAKECFESVMEFDNLRSDLHNEKRHTFIVVKNDPQLN